MEPTSIPASGVEKEDFFPEDEEAQQKLVDTVNKAFLAASEARQQHYERWRVFYKMYRSYVKKRGKGEWRSRVWMPIAFYVIETIAPRMVAQLPDFTVGGVGPEDAAGAEQMEVLVKWASDKSELYLELIKAIKSALMYGTGILKTTYDEQRMFDIRQEPMMQEQTMDMPTGEYDVDGNPITQSVSMGSTPTGETQMTRTEYISYQGPIAEAVDIEDFFPDPFADSIESARYVIHRVYRDKAHVERLFADGTYKRPDDDRWQQYLQTHSALDRMASVELGGGSGTGRDKTLLSLLEYWTDNVVVTVAGGNGTDGAGGTILLRADRNPFAHGEKPFVRIVDYLVPHEFWGIGELEPLEGVQETLNALWNSRIDNVKISINSMFAAVMDFMLDPSDLQVRPGGVIRVKEGIPVDQAFKRIDLGDVTQSSYTEAAEIERMAEKVSGVSPYQTGQDSPSYNRTATGIALISEQGNNRFAHKVKIAELTGFKRLGRQFGSLLQQFVPPEMVIRISGEQGQAVWQTVTQESIGGRFDYDIEAESSTQTESIRKEQNLSLFQMLGSDPLMNPFKMRTDVLKTFGKKNTQDYMITPEQYQQMQAQAAQQQAAGQPTQ